VDGDPIGAFDDVGLQPTKPNKTRSPVQMAGGAAGSVGSVSMWLQISNFSVPILNPSGAARCGPCNVGAAGPARLTPNFVVNSQGQAVPIPAGVTGPSLNANFSANITGWGYAGGYGGGTGLSPKVTSVRIMNPTPPAGPSQGYPGGYVNYMNKYGQSINPYTGRILSKDDPWWHIPLMCTPDG
jgi:hypothetical protein